MSTSIGHMREARIKIDPKAGEAVYHCISKAVGAAWLFDDFAKEILRRHLWRAADYCGVQVITYALLSNHFHVVVRVPKTVPVLDGELLRRYSLYRDTASTEGRAEIAAIRSLLAANGPEADQWRQKQLAQMGDVSAFMKKWKQRFGCWYNKSHGRPGTLWVSRFTSILIQATGFAAEFVSAYVDLNAVRASIVQDPKDYRFCGYAEAIAGGQKPREGLMSLYRNLAWKIAQARYRQTLFGIGADTRLGKAAIPYANFKKVIQEKGELDWSAVLLSRLRHFVHGGILGSRAFVQEQLMAYEKKTRLRPRTQPRPLPWSTERDELCVMRNVRSAAAA